MEKKQDLTIFSQRIRSLRKAKSMDQAYVAAEISKCRSTVSAYENSRITPPSKEIIKLAELYGVSAQSLFDLLPFTNNNAISIHDEISEVTDYIDFIESSSIGIILKNYPLSYSRLFYYFNMLDKASQDKVIEIIKIFVKSK